LHKIQKLPAGRRRYKCELQLQDFPDLLRYVCPSAQGFLPQRPRLALLVAGVGARIHSFGAGESAPPGCVDR